METTKDMRHMGTISNDDDGHGGEDGTHGGILDVALLPGLGGSHH